MSKTFHAMCHEEVVDATKISLGEQPVFKTDTKKNSSQQNTEDKHQRLLRDVVSETNNSTVATVIKASESSVSEWVSGKTPIPDKRKPDITRELELFIKTKLRRFLDIHDYISFCQEVQFGKVVDDE